MAIHNAGVPTLGATAAPPHTVITHMQYTSSVTPNPDGGITQMFILPDGTAHSFPVPRHMIHTVQRAIETAHRQATEQGA